MSEKFKNLFAINAKEIEKFSEGSQGVENVASAFFVF